MKKEYEAALNQVKELEQQAVSALATAAGASQLAVKKLDMIVKPSTSKAEASAAADVAKKQATEAKKASAEADAAAKKAGEPAKVTLTATAELPETEKKAIAKIAMEIAAADDRLQQAAEHARQLSKQAQDAANLATSLAEKKPA